MNYYEILGVPKDATLAQIKKAYRQKSKLHHPDRKGGDVKQMMMVNKAYEVLSHPEKRSYYDATGGEPPLTTVEQKARAVLAQLAVMVASQADPAINILRHVRDHLAQAASGHSDRIASMKKAQQHLERHAANITVEDREPNFIAQALLDQAKSIQGQIDTNQLEVDACNAARDLLKRYRCKSAQDLAQVAESLFFQVNINR